MTLNAAHLSTKNLESVCILFCCASSVRRKIPRSPRFYLSVNTLEGTAWIPHKITKITVYLSSWWLKDYFNCQGLFHTKRKMKKKKKTFYRRSSPYSLHLDGDHCRQSSPQCGQWWRQRLRITDAEPLPHRTAITLHAAHPVNLKSAKLIATRNGE